MSSGRCDKYGSEWEIMFHFSSPQKIPFLTFLNHVSREVKQKEGEEKMGPWCFKN